MKILFTTDNTNAPSTLLNAGLLKRLNAMDGVRIDFFNRNYKEYDAVLFMGYDPDIKGARQAGKNIKIGVIDPRPGFKTQPVGVDFILANGIEMKDWCLRFTPNIHIYHIYPVLNQKIRGHKKSDKVVLAYHGNKVHLESMHPVITTAIEMLAKEYAVELHAMYNAEKLGRWSKGLPRNAAINHIQWSEENYERFMSKADIGIVPNLLPVKRLVKGISTVLLGKAHKEEDSDYLLRFKTTSNAGRIFVFAQYGIPVVSDMFPSALQIIEDNVDGFVCRSTEAWHSALKRLAASEGLRSAIGEAMLDKFKKKFSPDIMNKGLIDFIKSL